MLTDRTSRLLAGVDVAREVGLEIGPLASPLVSRGEGRQIFYADYTNRESLREASRGDPNVDLDAIPEIDYIVSPPLPKDLGRKFDYILASHVIEHVPDLLGWLHALFGWLSPFGRVILAIPDKRYCFDYWRQLSTVGQVLEAFYEGRPRPPFHAIYDGFSQAVKIDIARAWQEVPYQDVLAPMFSKATALALAREAHETGCYRDCHCWVFTYHSFLQLIAELNELGVGGIRLLDHSAPVTYANEFQATLAPMRGQEALS